MKNILLKIPKTIFKKLSVVFTLKDPERSLVFMVPMFNANYALSFMFEGKGDQQKLKRIDVVCYDGYYHTR